MTTEAKTASRYQILLFWSDEDQAYVAEVPDLPGCLADGATRREAVANAETVIQEWLETARELGRDVPPPQGPRLLTIGQAARRSGLSESLLRRYCADGRLPARKVGRDWAIREVDLDAFLMRQRPTGRPPNERHLPAASGAR